MVVFALSTCVHDEYNHNFSFGSHIYVFCNLSFVGAQGMYISLNHPLV